MNRTDPNLRRPLRPEINLRTALDYLVIALIMIAIPVYIYLAFRTNINWDEFSFLSVVYAIQQGHQAPGLNTFHAFLYAWLPSIPGNEIDQIIAARLTQLVLFFAALYLLYRLACQFMPRTPALLMVLLILTYTDIIRHASSFRFDTLSLFFCITAVYLAASYPGRMSAAAAGATLGISFLVTIKTVIFLPLILALAAQPHKSDILTRSRLERLLIVGAVGLASFAALYLFQGLLFGSESPDAGQQEGIAARLTHIGTAMFLTEGLFPRASYLSRGISQNLAQWLLIGLGTIVCLHHAIFFTRWRRTFLTALLLLLPLLSVVLYRNAFPYYYVYIIPPALIIAGVAIQAGQRKLPQLCHVSSNQVVLVPILACILTASMYLTLDYPSKGIGAQRTVLNAVHQMFPEPVPYIGAHGMISSFPRHGFFMSTLGMQGYHARGEPVFQTIIAESQPVFLVASHRALIRDKSTALEEETAYLIDEDYEILRTSYIPHWGPILVAGKHFDLNKTGSPRQFQIYIEGAYRVESEQPILINSRQFYPGAIIQLNQGFHEISGPKATKVTLRYEIPGAMPDSTPPEGWLYSQL